ncbi:bifunctional histidinol-phosphatase/imidazoleglycerol-phosphate dehydratase HisB [Haliscomenobacter hydrossis]|uniref:Histidine biosynthesis bifunctional protein HisB n=1 Tax=Haliscomenobacter hydrossis (strain ATCC 27775 / DSM 1100 / LMG 10767 / O) TaxID=760192 RepID=F4KVG3_HALH1|nr:bifunctional histidinol-phosphatase/imidazoleglycerol-phosphate dehydratase HisB [Haliscomenobacter hydrossis]AEE51276.1 Imidazoleglycerol-phosphate dehydratase [Haliscomenobacter hydrossis DSM 1100]
MKKVLFIDRDGTLVLEPADYQVDALEKVEFYPLVFQYLSKIAQELDYELVMVTNQDGLGTDAYPEHTFWPAHNAIIKAFRNEGITFVEEIIDRTFPHENKPTRKPGTALLTHFMNGEYDLGNSFVIGDRITDVQLAKNLGAKAIWMVTDPNLGADEISNDARHLQDVIALSSTDWSEIYRFLKTGQRRGQVHRVTRETDVFVRLELDGQGRYNNQTGLGFFDHMLDQLAKHSGANLEIRVKGDLHIDEHHTVEDTAIALGEAFRQAVGDKMGMERYGSCILPMDDCLATAAIDFSGRPWLVWNATYRREKVGQVPTEMFYHFFKSFSDSALCNLNIKAEGENEHHKIEATFKAVAKAIKMAVKRDINSKELPSTKGIL